jgi:hypothetical protein
MAEIGKAGPKHRADVAGADQTTRFLLPLAYLAKNIILDVDFDQGSGFFATRHGVTMVTLYILPTHNVSKAGICQVGCRFQLED